MTQPDIIIGEHYKNSYTHGLAFWKKCFSTNITATAAHTLCLLGSFSLRHKLLESAEQMWPCYFSSHIFCQRGFLLFRGSRCYSCSDSTLCFITPPYNRAKLTLLRYFAYILRYNGNQPSVCSLCTCHCIMKEVWLLVAAQVFSFLFFFDPTSCDWQDPSTQWWFT